MIEQATPYHSSVALCTKAPMSGFPQLHILRRVAPVLSIYLNPPKDATFWNMGIETLSCLAGIQQ